MDSPENVWRELCFKLATERDPIKLAVFLSIGEISDYTQNPAATVSE
jgi:hypothetical protein